MNSARNVEFGASPVVWWAKDVMPKKNRGSGPRPEVQPKSARVRAVLLAYVKNSRASDVEVSLEHNTNPILLLSVNSSFTGEIEGIEPTPGAYGVEEGAVAAARAQRACLGKGIELRSLR